MSRSAYNFLVDVSLLCLLIGVLWTTSVVQFVFPPASRATGWTLWGYDLDGWCTLHGLAIAAFALNVLLHLILHWSWVCGYVTTRMPGGRRKVGRIPDGIKTIYGVSFFILVLSILGVLYTLAQFSIRAPSAGRAGQQSTWLATNG